MEDNFIDRLAKFIREKDIVLTDLVIVLPSQRAKKYLQRALFKAYQRPIFSPQIVTIDAWVRSLSSEEVIDPTKGLFYLYQIHQTINPQEDKGLDEFMKWGRTLLSDFDEIDRYLIHYKQLFKNLRDIKDIENWSFNTEEELTEAQKRFMAFWDMLPQYYVAYNKFLVEKSLTYMGKVYKHIAENIQTVFEGQPNRQFIFAGFNALSKAEKSIIKQLDQMGRAHVFVDADDFYVANKHHEAGMFIRDLSKHLDRPKLNFTENRLAHKALDIEVINCAQSTGQAKVSATLLKEAIPTNELSETLLLLADERLIVPVIKNIPNTVEKSNITLGLPLKNTSIRSWVDLLFRVQENFQQFKSSSIYHKDLVRFIKHPLVLAFVSKEDRAELAQLENIILTKNWLFINPQKINCSLALKELISLCFTPWKEGWQHVVPVFRSINKLLYAKTNPEIHAIERAVLYHFDRSLIALEHIMDEFNPKINLTTFKNLFNQYWMNESLAYYGNPLDGLQVMGLLETRLLDFKNIIVVGLNDGKMPPGNPIQTLIPMDLRKVFGLPTPREKQGLFAHHFYRLLHTAEKCWITFSSAEGSMGMEEPSRYIQQLKLELSRTNPAIQFKESFYTIKEHDSLNVQTTVVKSAAILKRLDEYFMKGTSASALGKYLTCPLDFYYRYVLGFGDEDSVEEDIEASTFGSFIHTTLEHLYLPFTTYDKEGKLVQEQPKPLSSIAIEGMKSKYEPHLYTQFEEHYSFNKEVVLTGKNYLSYEMAKHLTLQFLNKEQRALKEQQGHLYIHALEAIIQRDIEVEVDGEKKSVLFKGVIDRIDFTGEEWRILDYKSGKCETKDVTIAAARKKEPIDQLIFILKDRKYVFQLLVYNFLFFGKYKRYPEKTGIISLVNIHDGPFYLTNNLTSSMEELMTLFEEALSLIVVELYNTKIAFEHSLKSEYCNYCQ